VSGREWNPFLRFPKASLAVAALLCVPLLGPMARWSVSAEVRALLAGDERNLASFEQVRALLGDTEGVVISLELPHLFTAAGLAVVEAVSDAFARQPEVIEVKSLTHAVKPVRRGLGFEMVPLVPPVPFEAEELAEFKVFCLSHPLVRNLLVAADGSRTLVTVHYAGRAITAGEQARFRERVEATLEPFRAAGVRLRVLALPLIEEEIRGTLRRDLGRFVPAALIVVLAVLGWTVRSVRWVLFTLANQVAVLALLPGINGWLGGELTVFSVLLVPLVAGLHLTLLMHLLTAFQRAAASGGEPGAAVREALAVVAKPALLATLTTGFGLLSLGISGVPQVRDFGWRGAVCLAFMHAFTFGPGLALLTLTARWGSPSGGEKLAPARAGTSTESGFDLPAAFVRWVVRRGRAIRVAGGLAVVVALGGLALVRTDVRLIEMLGRDSPTRQALEELDRAYGGINVVSIEVDSGRPNGLNELAFLRYLERVQRFAEARPEPTGVFSYAQVLAMIHQIWEGGGLEALRLPDNAWLLRLFTTALRAYEFPFLTALADPEFRTARLVVRTRDMPAADYLRLIREVVRFAEQERPDGVTVSAAQGLHAILEADRRMLGSQRASVGLVLGVIGVCLAVLWRSVRLAGLALLTSVVPVALALAAAGYAQVPLNSINVMVGALALGIAQDDIVHFVTHWRMARRAGLPSEAALELTLRVKGRPIVWTSVILVAVFGLFALSGFPPVVQFGLLLAGAFVAAQAALLLFLPVGLERVAA
jgi:hypothetical protein